MTNVTQAKEARALIYVTLLCALYQFWPFDAQVYLGYENAKSNPVCIHGQNPKNLQQIKISSTYDNSRATIREQLISNLE